MLCAAGGMLCAADGLLCAADGMLCAADGMLCAAAAGEMLLALLLPLPLMMSASADSSSARAEAATEGPSHPPCVGSDHVELSSRGRAAVRSRGSGVLISPFRLTADCPAAVGSSPTFWSRFTESVLSNKGHI